MSATENFPKHRLLLVITKADVGGAQVHVLQILRGLSSNYDFLLITGEEGFLTNEARKLNISVKICESLTRSPHLWKDVQALWQIRKVIRTFKPAFVHAHSFKAGIIARIAAALSRAPCVFTAHGWVFTPGVSRSRQVIGRVIERWLAKLSQAIIVVSEHDRQLAQTTRIIASDKLFLVSNAAAEFDQVSNPAQSPVKLLTIGRLTTVKNHFLLLDAMVRLPVDLCLDVVGEGPLRIDLQRRIDALGLSSRVDLLGEVTDLKSLFEKSHIFVLCSNYEGLPLSILEAMAAGLPVVSTRVGGVGEAVLQGKTGLLVPPGDADALASAVRELASEPAKRAAMGALGRDHYEQNYTEARFVTEIAEVYLKTISAISGLHEERNRENKLLRN